MKSEIFNKSGWSILIGVQASEQMIGCVLKVEEIHSELKVDIGNRSSLINISFRGLKIKYSLEVKSFEED